MRRRGKLTVAGVRQQDAYCRCMLKLQKWCELRGKSFRRTVMRACVREMRR